MRCAGRTPLTRRQHRRGLAGSRQLIVLSIRLGMRWFGRQRQRSGIVAAGELHQRLHAGLDRRVGREQIRKTLARVVEAQFHDR